MKRCYKCNQEKPYSDFSLNKSHYDGFSSECRDCVNAYNRAYYIKNQSKVKETVRKYRLENPEIIRKRKADYHKRNKDKIIMKVSEWQKNNPERVKLQRKLFGKRHRQEMNMRAAQRRARIRNNGVFFVTKKEIKKLYASPCFYCGADAEHIDHLIPISRGGRHSIGNLLPACANCNHAKSNKFLAAWKREKNESKSNS